MDFLIGSQILIFSKRGALLHAFEYDGSQALLIEVAVAHNRRIVINPY